MIDRYRHALLLVACAALTACGGGSDSAGTGGQASNRAVVSATDTATGIEASGVCNGNPDAGAVGDIHGLLDGNAATFFGAKSTRTDSGGNHAGLAVVDCTVTVNFNGAPPAADYARLTGTVSGSWHDNNADFYFYQGLHALADVYTLDSAGGKTLITSQEEEIDPHCLGEVVPATHQTLCGFTVPAGDAAHPLAAGTVGVEFDLHFSTLTSATTCYTTCTNTLESHLTGLGVVKSGVEILATGS
jgi:hypothetical protein